MKILHANITCSGGGLEQYLYQLFAELKKRGHSSVLLHGDRSGDPKLCAAAKVYCIENITQHFCSEISQKLDLVRRVIEEEKPDLVYIHQVLNFPLIKLLAGIRPSVRFIHGFKMICPDGRKILRSTDSLCHFPLGFRCQTRAYFYRCMPRNPFLGLPLIRIASAIARIHRLHSHMVVASDFMKSVLQYNDFEEERISVNSYFTSLPTQQLESKTKDGAVILAVGRMVPEKGIDFLLQSFAAIESGPTLVICGDGPSLKEMKALASELGISSRVSFPGWVSHDQLHRFFSQCSLVVVPSVWPEPFGIVGIEAMAHGRPVIAFDVGGISEWLKDGETGFLVPRGDLISLTQRIDFLLHHPKMAEEMGISGRNSVMKRFLPEHHLDRLLSIFDRTIEAFGTLRRYPGNSGTGYA